MSADFTKTTDPVRNDRDRLVQQMIARYESVIDRAIGNRNRWANLWAEAQALYAEYTAATGPGAPLEGAMSPAQQAQVAAALTTLQEIEAEFAKSTWG